MSAYEFKAYANADELARAAARDWLNARGNSSAPQRVAFSGGRIAKNFFEAAAQLAATARIALGNMDFFWADERCVPPDSPDSNFLLAQKYFFQPLAIADSKIHRLKGELAPAAAVAEANAAIGAAPLDLIFLGLGEDGHVASLMPTIPDSAVKNPGPYLHIANSPKPPPNRLSLSYAAIAAAKNVWMLASGPGKEEALRQSLRSNPTTPFGRVLQSRANTVIYSDIRL